MIASRATEVEETYDLAGQVIGLAMKVHGALGPGFVESIYQNALCLELERAGMAFEREKLLTVHYSGRVVGEFRTDVIVRDELLVEIKALQALAPAHGVQIVNYLTATGKNHGLLLNFGASKLEFKRKFREYKPRGR